MKCIVVDDEKVSREIVKGYISRTEGLDLVKEFERAPDAIEFIKQGGVDLAFLDVEMPGMTGMEMVQTLDNAPQIIMITGKESYAVQAFEFSVTDYLIKPVTYDRFQQAVQKVRQNHEKQVWETTGAKDIYVKSDGKIVRIKMDAIRYVEALSDYVIINTDGKKHVVHSTMKNIERRLPTSIFVRVHRSFIVNIHKIDIIEDMNITMPGDKLIPIGASYRANFMERLNFL